MTYLDNQIADRIRNCLVEIVDPAKIIIFGSYGRGDATEDSDIDIAVIADDVQSANRDMLIKSRVALRQALKGTGLAVDFILQSQAKFDAAKRERGSISQAIDAEGVVIYERHQPKLLA